MGKRKTEDTDNRTAGVTPSPKKPRTAKSKGKAREVQPWPDHFVQLEKTFKALNTVMAFCSSRKNMAVTFNVIRSSVENILRHPLDLGQVAEIKALLPEVIRFAYVDQESIKVHDDGPGRKNQRGDSPDLFALPAEPSATEHVLVLDFIDDNKNTKKIKEGFSKYSLPVPLTPDQLKKLIEKRSERFTQGVNELITACTKDGEDPVSLLQAAAKAHVPVHPNAPQRASSPMISHLPVSVPAPADRLPISEIIAHLKHEEAYRNQIVKHKVFDPKAPTWGKLNRSLSRSIVDALNAARKVDGFYAHQAAALNAIWSGKNVIVSTSTASGKSIIYQVPALCNLEEDKSSTAFFIYPTKALAQDQMTAIQQLLTRCAGLEDVKVATYDGDTPKEARSGVRDNASIIFTNFDTLHASIMPNEDSWRRFLKNLKMVVVDELHYYSGLFGTQVALVMRRLRRLCAAVGNRRCIFISCSATINNPREHMTNIFGVEDIEVVTEDGAPSGRKDFLLWNPPYVDEMDPGVGRVSSMSEASHLFRTLVKHGVRTIIFCKIRRSCEMMMKTVRTALTAEGRTDILDRVVAYRGGYSIKDRRRIEQEAFAGHLLGIIATNALELGVDIGTLDAVIMLGFPHGIASLRQQAGRAGRRARDSLAILVGDSFPIDQHYMQNPDEVFEKPTEPLVVDLSNEVILENHLQCAAHELPIRFEEDNKYFGPAFGSVCTARLTRDKEGWYHTHPSFKPYPSSHVSLRGLQEDRYTIVDVTNIDQQDGGAKVLEEVEMSRAIFETYEGGVFMHQGLTYLVNEVSHDTRIAKIARADVNWITKPRDFTDVDAMQTYRIREIRGSTQRAYYGRISVQTNVFGFFKIRNNVILDAVDLETPPFKRSTNGMWVDVPRSTLELLLGKGINPAEAIHAAEHAVMSILPMFAMSAPGDVGTECKAPTKEYMERASQRKRPARLIFYDSAGKCTGVCAKAFDRSHDLISRALGILETCECEDGCPACVRSFSCREDNLVCSKVGAKVLLRGVLNLPVDEANIRDQENPHFLTIVEANPLRDEGIEVEPDEE